jgi:DNA-binding CsgD family transcriptional regulator
MLMGKDRCLAGDTMRGLADLARAVTLAEPGPVRGQALAELGAMEGLVYRPTEARAHLEAALHEEGIDDALRCYIHANLALTNGPIGDEATFTPRAEKETLRHADAALTLARSITELAPRAYAYSAALHATLLREGRLAEELVAEAPELWEELPALPMSEWPRVWLAYHLLAVGDPRGHGLVLELLETAGARGDEVTKAGLLAFLAEWMAETGEWRDGITAAEQSFVLEDQLYEEANGRALVAWFEAALGDALSARKDATSSLQQERVIPWAREWARGSLGLLELSLGRPREALAQLELLGIEQPAAGSGNPRMSSFLPDLIEALVAVGRLDEADDHVAWLEERGATLDRPYASAAGARGRGLLEAARGDLDAALTSLDRALHEHERVAMPYEFARTLLIQGSIQRRAGKKRLARETLERARSVFDELGAALWTQRVDAEIGHITGRRSGPGKLTDAERNVARLAAAGFRNREIAEQLFLSVRTVEGHLSDAYGKLGIRSRTELAQFVDDIDDEGKHPGPR